MPNPLNEEHKLCASCKEPISHEIGQTPLLKFDKHVKIVGDEPGNEIVVSFVATTKSGRLCCRQCAWGSVEHAVGVDEFKNHFESLIIDMEYQDYHAAGMRHPDQED